MRMRAELGERKAAQARPMAPSLISKPMRAMEPAGAGRRARALARRSSDRKAAGRARAQESPGPTRAARSGPAPGALDQAQLCEPDSAARRQPWSEEIKAPMSMEPARARACPSSAETRLSQADTGPEEGSLARATPLQAPSKKEAKAAAGGSGAISGGACRGAAGRRWALGSGSGGSTGKERVCSGPRAGASARLATGVERGVESLAASAGGRISDRRGAGGILGGGANRLGFGSIGVGGGVSRVSPSESDSQGAALDWGGAGGATSVSPSERESRAGALCGARASEWAGAKARQRADKRGSKAPEEVIMICGFE